MWYNKTLKNFFCVDLEEWYNANLAQCDSNEKYQPRIEENVHALLDLFDRHGVKATFFVLSSVAENFPDLIRAIEERGHEIASHGYAHQLVYTQSQDEFREDVRRGKRILDEICRKPVIGYRAPSWSITEKSLWALKILKEEGFCYDSSIFPFKNFLYGIANAPSLPYRTTRYHEETDLLEIPPSTLRIGHMNFPFSGGFYFRVLPYWVVRYCILRLNKGGHPAVMYIHPWEIDPGTPRLKLSFRDSLIQYYGISGCRKKLEKLFREFSFTNLGSYHLGNTEKLPENIEIK